MHAVLQLSRTAWRIYRKLDDCAIEIATQSFAAEELSEQGSRILEALASEKYKGEAIIVALGADWCLSTTISVANQRELRDRQSVLFRLEESIPWNAEEFVGDYITSGKNLFLVAAPTDPLGELFQNLESNGAAIQAIVPAALLAWSEHSKHYDSPDRHVVVLEDGECIDLVYVEGRRPMTWTSLPSNSSVLTQELLRLAMESGTLMSVIGYGVSAAHQEALKACEAISDTSFNAEVPTRYLAVFAGTRILLGEIEPPLDLKRDAFGRSFGNVALARYRRLLDASMALVALCVIAAGLFRTDRIIRDTERVVASQSDVYRGAFPNSKVPTGITSRLESELAKLKGLQGEDSSLSPALSVTSVLFSTLSAAPTDRRFRLLEIRIEEGRLYLDGEVRDHSDAEIFAQRLRAQGIEVPPPKTLRLDDKRVSLRITGTAASKAIPTSQKSS